MINVDSSSPFLISRSVPSLTRYSGLGTGCKPDLNLDLCRSTAVLDPEATQLRISVLTTWSLKVFSSGGPKWFPSMPEKGSRKRMRTYLQPSTHPQHLLAATTNARSSALGGWSCFMAGQDRAIACSSSLPNKSPILVHVMPSWFSPLGNLWNWVQPIGIISQPNPISSNLG